MLCGRSFTFTSSPPYHGPVPSAMLCRSPSGGTADRRPLKPAAESHCIPRSFTTAQTVARRVVGNAAECIELRAGRMARLRSGSHHARLIHCAGGPRGGRGRGRGGRLLQRTRPTHACLAWSTSGLAATHCALGSNVGHSCICRIPCGVGYNVMRSVRNTVRCGIRCGRQHWSCRTHARIRCNRFTRTGVLCSGW